MMSIPWLIVIALVFGIPTALIIRKAGYSAWWVLLWFVPLVNVTMLWVFALSRWPIEERIKS